MEVASLSCKRRRANRKSSEPPTQKVLVSRNEESDSDESDSSAVLIQKIVIRRTSRVRSETMFLCHDIYCKMKKCQLPFALFNLIWWLARRAKASNEENVDHIEWFAGVANIHKGMKKLGLHSVALDVRYDSVHHNYIDKKGMLHSVQMQRRLRRRGGQHLATVCSSWTFVNRATSRRYDTVPLGVPPCSQSVVDANQMVSLCSLMWLWAWCAGCYTILEQPLGSLMGCHPRIVQVMRTISSFRHLTTHMGAFGGPSPKPTNLYADAPYANRLVRTPTAADRARCDFEDKEIMTRDPITGSLTGGKDMKGSQAYPEGYGLEVAAAYKNYVDTVPDELADSECSSEEGDLLEKDAWVDSGIHEVCDWLGLPSTTMAM